MPKRKRGSTYKRKGKRSRKSRNAAATTIQRAFRAAARKIAKKPRTYSRVSRGLSSTSGNTGISQQVLRGRVSYDSHQLLRYRADNVNINSVHDSCWMFGIPLYTTPRSLLSQWFDGGNGTTGPPSGSSWNDYPRWSTTLSFDRYELCRPKSISLKIVLDIRHFKHLLTTTVEANREAQLPFTDYTEIVSRNFPATPWGVDYNSETLKDVVRLMVERKVGLKKHGLFHNRSPSAQWSNNDVRTDVGTQRYSFLQGPGKFVTIHKTFKFPFNNAKRNHLDNTELVDDLHTISNDGWMKTDHIPNTEVEKDYSPWWAIVIRRHHEAKQLTATEFENEIKVISIDYSGVWQFKKLREDQGYADAG